MKKLISKHPGHFLFMLVMFFTIIAKAQKLPSVQKVSLRAPDNLKIDGKATEWKNFQAYNNNTGFFYSIANDDEKLYLCIQAKDPDIINRIVGGGITFSIQKSDDKKGKSSMSITYPIGNPKSPVAFGLRPLSSERNHPDTTAKTADSVMTMRNNTMAKQFKTIGVRGVKAVDTLISIYNDDDIKAAGLINSKKEYTLEISIALKHLNLSTKKGDNFTYHIQVNGLKIGNELFGTIKGTPEQVAKTLQQHADSEARKAANTNFSGNYKLLIK